MLLLQINYKMNYKMNYYYGVKNIDSTFAAELDDKYRDLNDVISNGNITRKNKLDVFNLILIITSEDDINKALSILEKLDVVSIFVVVDAESLITRYNIYKNLITTFGKIEYKLFIHNSDHLSWNSIATKINKTSEKVLEDTINGLKFFTYFIISICVLLVITSWSLYFYEINKCNNLDKILDGIKIINNIQSQLYTLDTKMSMLDLAVRYSKLDRFSESGR